jgi:hypothetical protein
MRSKYPKISAISSVALVLEVRHSCVPRTGQSSPAAEDGPKLECNPCKRLVSRLPGNKKCPAFLNGCLVLPRKSTMPTPLANVNNHNSI